MSINDNIAEHMIIANKMSMIFNIPSKKFFSSEQPQSEAVKPAKDRNIFITAILTTIGTKVKNTAAEVIPPREVFRYETPALIDL